jgi:hypothetical protein
MIGQLTAWISREAELVVPHTRRLTMSTRSSSAATSAARHAPGSMAASTQQQAASVTVAFRQQRPSTAVHPTDQLAPATSYGAWTHANPHLTRQERTEGLRHFMQARGDVHVGHSSAASAAAQSSPAQTADATPSISCGQQPARRADRVAQIQRFAEATRAVGNIDYSQQSADQSASTNADPIIVSPLPAGWQMSQMTGMPVFSFGEWCRSHDDSQMDRVAAARQFVRYVRQ